MYVVSLLAIAVQEQVPFTPASADDGRMWLWIALGVGVLALGAALMLARAVIAADTGTADMRAISDAIREGAEAFLKRQYRTIGAIAVVLAVLLFFGYHLSPRTAPFALKTVVSFLMGAVCSALAGYTGMYCSIRANIRTASAARTSLNAALRMALHGGAVTGLVVVALSLLGVGVLFLFFGGLENPQAVPYQLVGFGFGASLVALFAQLGGGIYTKAADVGADLVGKVEAGIPEDDPRNPAVIADLVGDNVGDCAGRGADLFELTAAENIGTMILAVALFTKLENYAPEAAILAIFFPFVARAFGLLSSIVGIFSVKLKNDSEDPMRALNRGYYITTVLGAVGLFVAVRFLLGQIPGANYIWFFFAGLIGMGNSFVFVWITEYYTEHRYRPVRSIAHSSATGSATNIISGLAVGMESTAMPVVAISVSILGSFYCGLHALPMISGTSAGLFGTAVATEGMLATCAYILAMDTFGPITDNAGGIAEMSHQPQEVRDRTDRLDSVGNTTKALTKGYAIGSAALAAFLLFSAYLDEVAVLGSPLAAVDISKPEVFVGGLLGAMLVFWFSALAIGAVTKTAVDVIKEVRRQFQA